MYVCMDADFETIWRWAQLINPSINDKTDLENGRKFSSSEGKPLTQIHTVENSNPRSFGSRKKEARLFNKEREKREESRVIRDSKEGRKEVQKFHFGPPLELNLRGVGLVVKNATFWLAEKSWRDGNGERGRRVISRPT